MESSAASHLRPEGNVRVILVSPHSLPRLGLARIVESISDTELVAHAGTTFEALRLADTYKPDIVVMDAELAADEGMAPVEQLKQRNGLKVLLLAERAAHAQIESALEAGADGYTLKDISVAELGSTLKRLAEGDTVLHPQAASALAKRYSSNGREKTAVLTPRQREILRLLASGLENKQIARKLGIGVHTVKTHVSRILHKLGASSRTEAVVFALRDRMIS